MSLAPLSGLQHLTHLHMYHTTAVVRLQLSLPGLPSSLVKLSLTGFNLTPNPLSSTATGLPTVASQGIGQGVPGEVGSRRVLTRSYAKRWPSNAYEALPASCASPADQTEQDEMAIAPEAPAGAAPVDLDLTGPITASDRARRLAARQARRVAVVGSSTGSSSVGQRHAERRARLAPVGVPHPAASTGHSSALQQSNTPGATLYLPVLRELHLSECELSCQLAELVPGAARSLEVLMLVEMNDVPGLPLHVASSFPLLRYLPCAWHLLRYTSF